MLYHLLMCFPKSKVSNMWDFSGAYLRDKPDPQHLEHLAEGRPMHLLQNIATPGHAVGQKPRTRSASDEAQTRLAKATNFVRLPVQGQSRPAVGQNSRKKLGYGGFKSTWAVVKSVRRSVKRTISLPLTVAKHICTSIKAYTPVKH